MEASQTVCFKFGWLADYSQVDILGLRYKSVKFGAKSIGAVCLEAGQKVVLEVLHLPHRPLHFRQACLHSRLTGYEPHKTGYGSHMRRDPLKMNTPGLSPQKALRGVIRWTRVDVLGAISWAFIGKSYQNLPKLTFD